MYRRFEKLFYFVAEETSAVRYEFLTCDADSKGLRMLNTCPFGWGVAQ